MYWMELITESGLMTEARLAELHTEADEILSIIVTSINTSKQSS